MSLPTLNITRGDYKKISFMRHSYNGTVITILPDDVYFTVKKNSRTKEFIFQKKLSEGTITFDSATNLYSFELLPEDTNDLCYGRYSFDVEVMLAHGRPSTICIGNFEVKPEITWAENE